MKRCAIALKGVLNPMAEEADGAQKRSVRNFNSKAPLTLLPKCPEEEAASLAKYLLINSLQTARFLAESARGR
jgi:hypothetical protein